MCPDTGVLEYGFQVGGELVQGHVLARGGVGDAGVVGAEEDYLALVICFFLGGMEEMNNLV